VAGENGLKNGSIENGPIQWSPTLAPRPPGNPPPAICARFIHPSRRFIHPSRRSVYHAPPPRAPRRHAMA
jgi:hypothetical protein